MAGERRSGRGPAEFDLNKFAERLERRDDALRSRVETLFDGMDERLGRIEQDIASGRLDREGVRAELSEVRRDLGEGRESMSLLSDAFEEHIRHTDNAAATAVHASAAAATAATGATVSAVSLLVALSSAKLWQKGGALAAMFCALAWMADKGPAVVRFLNTWGHSVAVFWKGVGG